MSLCREGGFRYLENGQVPIIRVMRHGLCAGKDERKVQARTAACGIGLREDGLVFVGYGLVLFGWGSVVLQPGKDALGWV